MTIFVLLLGIFAAGVAGNALSPIVSTDTETLPPTVGIEEPVVFESLTPRAAGSTTLPIRGSGFYSPAYPTLKPEISFTPALPNATLTDIKCESVSGMYLCKATASFPPIPPAHVGKVLFAKVYLVSEANATAAQVAVVRPPPVISPFGAARLLESGSRSMDIHGSGFSSEPLQNEVRFTAADYSLVAGTCIGVRNGGTVLTVQLSSPPRQTALGPLNATVSVYGATSPTAVVASVVMPTLDCTSQLVCESQAVAGLLPIVVSKSVRCTVYVRGNGMPLRANASDFAIDVQDHRGEGAPGQVSDVTVTEDETQIVFTYTAPKAGSSEQLLVRTGPRSSSPGGNVRGSPITIDLLFRDDPAPSFWARNRELGYLVLAALAAVVLGLVAAFLFIEHQRKTLEALAAAKAKALSIQAPSATVAVQQGRHGPAPPDPQSHVTPPRRSVGDASAAGVGRSVERLFSNAAPSAPVVVAVVPPAE